MNVLVDWLNGIVWSSALVYLILGVGLFYTIATRFFQLRHFKDMIKLTFNGTSSAEGVSSFQALTMSVGSRVGIGNIAGVAKPSLLVDQEQYFGCGLWPFYPLALLLLKQHLHKFIKVNKMVNIVGVPLIILARG